MSTDDVTLGGENAMIQIFRTLQANNNIIIILYSYTRYFNFKLHLLAILLDSPRFEILSLCWNCQKVDNAICLLLLRRS